MKRKELRFLSRKTNNDMHGFISKNMYLYMYFIINEWFRIKLWCGWPHVPIAIPPLPSPPTHAFSISWVRGFSPIKIKFFLKFWIWSTPQANIFAFLVNWSRTPNGFVLLSSVIGNFLSRVNLSTNQTQTKKNDGDLAARIFPRVRKSSPLSFLLIWSAVLVTLVIGFRHSIQIRTKLKFRPVLLCRKLEISWILSKSVGYHR